MKSYLKIFLLTVALCIFIACKHQLIATQEQITRYPSHTYVNNWDAEDRIENYRCDDCIDGEAVEFRGDLFKLIRRQIPDLRRWELVRARYKEEDIKMYALRNGYREDDERSKINGYATFFLRITTTRGQVDYFDITSICPPPSGCQRAKDSTYISTRFLAE